MAAVLSESVLVQNGPNDHFGQNDLIPNWILAFAVHFGPFWPEEVHFGPFRSANRTPAIPEFSAPCEMRFFPREKGKMAFVEGFSLKRPFSLSRVGKIASCSR